MPYWELLSCLRMNVLPCLSRKSLGLSVVTDVTVSHGRGTRGSASQEERGEVIGSDVRRDRW